MFHGHNRAQPFASAHGIACCNHNLLFTFLEKSRVHALEMDVGASSCRKFTFDVCQVPILLGCDIGRTLRQMSS